MKASEAFELANTYSTDNKRLLTVLNDIKSTAENGKFEAYFINLGPFVKKELRALGYRVESCSSRNESNDTVYWEEGG